MQAATIDHPDYGGPARELYENAQAILKRIVAEKRLTARGVYGFWPANTVSDDIVIYKDDARRVELARFHMAVPLALSRAPLQIVSPLTASHVPK